MGSFLLRRLLAALPVLGVVAIIVFALLRLAPGDPATVMAGDNATADQLEALRRGMGLEKPILEQFFIWIVRVLHGDFGNSLISGLPVSQMVADRFGPSLALCM